MTLTASSRITPTTSRWLRRRSSGW